MKIVYSDAGSYAIYNDDGNVMAPTDWDDDLMGFGVLPRTRCGENRYIGVENILEFYITPDCPLKIMPRDALMLGVRLEFTLDEFFAVGGVVTFVDRMAASLGIHAADIKVVAVYEGSTIIDFEIISDFLADDPLDLDEVQQTFEEAISMMETFMGSTVLSASSNYNPIVTPSTVLEVPANIWDNLFCTDCEEEEIEVEQNVTVEVRYIERST